jgi:DNA-binding winged helix-turn-helix (wHTH) protein/tetratricopeptide (TPR) repeat protein
MKARRSFRFGRFELRPADHMLLEAGTPVRLTPKAFDTLAALVRERGALVSREALMRDVWPDTFVEDGGLTQNISVLRKLLNQPGQPELIETVPRRGYRFAGIVDEVRDANEEMRLAVLPFAVGSDDGLSVDLADGLAADLIDAIGAIGSIRVTSLSAAARYRDGDPLRTARALGVDAIVVARLRIRDASVQFDVELVDGDDGARLWAHRFECAREHFATLPFEAATQMARALGIAPAGDVRAHHDRRQPHRADAYTDYLEGRHHLAQRTIERVDRAIDKFERAIERDPEYALAYAGLAEAYTLAASAEYGGNRWAESMARAKSAAMRAMTIDEGLSQAHAALALVHFRLDWNWALAEAEFRRALALNAGDADVHHAFALYLIAMERRTEAVAEAVEAHRLQPVSLIIGTGLGRILHFAGESDRAIEQFRRVRELEPSFAQVHFDLSLAYAGGRRLDEAIAACRAAIALAPGRPVSRAVLANYLARAGQVDEAREILRELERLTAARQASPFDVAIAHCGFGDVERAIDGLRGACRERHGLLVYLRIEPLWNPLRGDPRFEDLLRRIGLVQRF